MDLALFSLGQPVTTLFGFAHPELNLREVVENLQEQTLQLGSRLMSFCQDNKQVVVSTTVVLSALLLVRIGKRNNPQIMEV
jgi:diphthamide synthase subunit DPH2